ncbi:MULTISPECIES: hypothetical protein [unclassified Microbacterium]|uniref:hypothetical protein n=1 Tax=unclassified Microbacterium TaxID=2609290 RepID=UPI00203E75FB|nr:hypothetical protein [Microbacterium sp. USTB-Y]
MTESTPHPARMLTRRRMLVAGAWSVPVIAVAVAAPRAAASGEVVLELLGASDDALTMTVPVGGPDSSSDAFYVTATGTGSIPQNWTARMLGATGIAGWDSSLLADAGGDGVIVPLDAGVLALPFFALKAGSFVLRISAEGTGISKDFAITLVVA